MAASPGVEAVRDRRLRRPASAADPRRPHRPERGHSHHARGSGREVTAGPRAAAAPELGTPRRSAPGDRRNRTAMVALPCHRAEPPTVHLVLRAPAADAPRPWDRHPDPPPQPRIAARRRAHRRGPVRAGPAPPGVPATGLHPPHLGCVRRVATAGADGHRAHAHAFTARAPAVAARDQRRLPRRAAVRGGAVLHVPHVPAVHPGHRRQPATRVPGASQGPHVLHGRPATGAGHARCHRHTRSPLTTRRTLARGSGRPPPHLVLRHVLLLHVPGAAARHAVHGDGSWHRRRAGLTTRR